jgi:hypothetical protein
LNVLDFRRSKHRDKRLRRERQHLALLVFALVLAAAIIENARHPEVWHWLIAWPASQSPSATQSQIDNRFDGPAAEPTGPGLLASPATTIVSPPHTTSQLATTEKNGADEPEGVPRQLSDVASISFEAISDDTPSSVAEREVSLQLFNVLKHSDESKIRRHSVGPVTYAQLFRQSDAYRGKLATVSGIVRRAQRLDVAANPYGIEAYYQVWLFPKDNPVSPVIAYCLRLPKGFPLGKEIVEDVALTGFFFKRCAYRAKDTMRTAPTLLAKTLHWDKRPSTSELPTSPFAMILMAACGIALAGILLIYIYWRSRPARRATPLERRPDFDHLREVPQGREGDG